MAQVIVIVGDLTLETAEEAQGRAMLAIGEDGLILDLNQVSFITTPGIGMLLELQKAVRAKGGKLALRGVQPRVIEVIRRTQLDRVLEIA